MPPADPRVLVAYATQHGSTREVAEAGGDGLKAAGVEADVRPVGDVRHVGDFAVVFGAPLYMGRFPKDGRRFLRRHRRALAGRPIAVFALGPVKDTDEQWKGSREQLDRLLGKLPWLRPIAVQLFGGAIDPAKLRFPFKKMEAGDVRDWQRIRAWARDLADPFRAA
jgi:menaquinone-dependent protoporphyrinogen oxidase